jgi:hypothetical protein
VRRASSLPSFLKKKTNTTGKMPVPLLWQAAFFCRQDAGSTLAENDINLH